MVAPELGKFHLILASASPRRRQILTDAGISYTASAVECDESWPPHLKGKAIAEFLASLKSDAWAEALEDKDILITADTIVWCHGQLLGKPADRAEAHRFLTLLSGCNHSVITALCIRDRNRKHVFSVTTEVTFRKLSDEEISYYIEHYSPYDKAGAYGIQEWIGLRGITSIRGSYYNVVGMPVSELYDELIEFISK